MNRRICAILLCLCMLMGMLPMVTQAALVEDTSAYITQQLYLGDDLTLHLRGSVDYLYAAHAVATVTYGDRVDTYRLEDLSACDDGQYEITVDMAAAQMAETIRLTITVGSLVIVDKTYSVRDYVQYILEGAYTEETKALCYELLNYGAWAQKYFDYDADHLTNEDYESQPAYEMPSESPVVITKGSVSGIRYYGATVRFISETAVRHYFDAPNGVAGYTFTVDGKTYTPALKDGLYYIEIPGINPQDMDKEMSVAVTDGSNTLSFAYAPSYYFIRSYHKATNENHKGLMHAAYSYFMAAKAFAGAAAAKELTLTYSSGDSKTLALSTNLPSGLALSSCDVGESVSLTGTVLNFSFENAVSAGQTYTLPKGTGFVFTDGSEFGLIQDYIFEFNGTGWTLVVTDAQEPAVPADPDNLLLGFDSYAEVTGAKIAVGNMLGRMEINGDMRYITQGEASLKVAPQGDYDMPGKHPYFKVDTSTMNADFASFKNISFDVYNAESEDLHIKVSFVLGEYDTNNYVILNQFTTVKETYTLKANSWTTCTYDLSVMAGYSFYTLSNIRYMTVEFLEHKTSKTDTPNVLYIDNLRGEAYGEDEGPVTTDINYRTGIDFETHGEEYLFTGQGNIEEDATIERASLTTAGIAIREDNGNYALRLSSDSTYYPRFRIHFGEVLPGGSRITFIAYGKINGANLYNQSIFEFTGGGEATVQFACGQWTELTLTLPNDAEYVDLFWNYDRAAITSENASGEVYIDNIKAITDVEPAGDFVAGVGFEVAGNAVCFTGQGNSATDPTIKRVTYKSLGISAPTNGGDYALKMSRTDKTSPTFRINFGEVLRAGTQITFTYYGKVDILSFLNSVRFTVNGTNTDWGKCGQWNTVTVTLPAEAEHLDISFSYRYTSLFNTGEVYLDNVQVTEPAITAVGDFTQGVDFEVSGNKALFTGQGSDNDASIKWVTYSSQSIEALTDGGTYALKLTHASFYWPTFRINFGKELAAGTQLSFWAYGKIYGTSRYNQSIFEFSDSSGGGEATAQFACDQWTKLTITLPAAADHIDLYWNMDRAQITDINAYGEVYLDNFLAEEPIPPSGDFTEGVGFEEEGNEGRFTGQAIADRDAVIEKVSYAELGITPPANGGTYALKLSHASNYWPTFRIHFGKTLMAGTEISFWAYGKINGLNLYDQSIFEFMSGGEATKQFKCGSWTKLTITLPAEADHIDLFWNYDRANIQSATASGEVYLDNFLATVPTEEVEPSNDITEGIGFETEGNELFFTGIGYDQDATVERVSYADAGITAADNGGDYVLKLSHASHYYPTFQLNFGKTLPAGTVITFNAYGTFDGWKSGNDMNIEFTGDSGSSQVVYMLPEQWFTATITLTEDRDHLQFFWNIERNNGVSGAVASRLYIDNVKAEEPNATFANGLGFESDTDTGYFTGVGGSNTWRDATLTKVSYADAGITAAENGGDYALKLTCTSSYWPTFRINFGKTLPAGTVITFDAYTRDITTTNITTVTIFEYVSGGEATTQYYYNTWNQQSFTLSQATDHIDLVCTLDRWEKTSACTNVEVYLDNFKAVESDS